MHHVTALAAASPSPFARAGQHDGWCNRLLESLPRDTQAALRTLVEWVPLAHGELLHEAGRPLRHVHFPATAVVSLVSSMQDGASAEVAVVGSEGVVGVAAFMGGQPAQTDALVQGAGHAWRMSATGLAQLARASAPLMQALLGYTQALMTQMAQTSACYRHHAIDQQLCRWLLMQLDRLQGDELHATQDGIAGLLGVRREGVTVAALKLQRAGLIRYVRGRIAVLDRAGLQARSCECYRVLAVAHG